MCGIFIAFNAKNTGFGARQFKDAVLASSHRGPDNIGEFSGDGCYLGHSRLSIIGIESNGNQPFHFKDLVLTFNGEIFNYIELREELIACGYSFETRSDTEVVLKAFDRWGPECFPKFNGMWALAIYDRIAKTLTVSRDRFGQKPLFVLCRAGATYFASEVSQLLPFTDVEIDFGLIQKFLKEGTYEGGGRTFFQSVEEFPKAHYAVFHGEGVRDIVRYWDYWSGEIKDADEMSFREFSELLRDSVRIRLRADVPVGVLLSGGVDSSLISALTRDIAGPDTKISAFTFASENADDESRYAKRVAESLNLTLMLSYQDSNPNIFRERLRGIVQHMGRGHSSPAVVSIDGLYGAVADAGIRVALDGQGADELLAGYQQYFVVIISLLLLKGEFKQAAMFLKSQIRWGYWNAVILYLRGVLPESFKRFGRELYGYERLFKRYERDGKLRFINPVESPGRNGNALNRHLIKLHDVGLANLLYYGDIVAMKHSVENRSPFMDHRLVEFAFSRSEKLKLWDGRDKFVLRCMSEYKLLHEVLERRKIGFSSDIRPATKRMMMDELTDSPILAWPIFSAKLPEFLQEGGFEAPKYERLLFRLYQVHLWNEIFQVKR